MAPDRVDARQEPRVSQGTVPPVITAYFEAVNGRDVDALSALFADDVELRPVGSPPLRGRDAVIAYYPPLIAGFAELRDEPVRVSVAGDVVTVEIAVVGRTLAGADVAFDAVDVFDLDADGRIVRLSLWYDTRDVARQVRAVTASDPTGARHA
jgi:ketosteroid isomerase-like protein